ncbi:MAG: alpha/beta hydrolase [Spirochaetaceae bacterium]|nr:MAG: alpha/beta hydrolase [Spirochaetaceae bacterium]
MRCTGTQRILQLVVFSILAGGFVMCAHTENGDELPFERVRDDAAESGFNSDTTERLRESIPELGNAWSADARSDYEAYRRHWQFALDAETLAAGLVRTGTDDTVFVQVLRSVENGAPDAPVAFFVHGYLDHTPTNRYAIEALLDAGITVITMDLPGHGLSSGRRAYIDDFEQYAQAVEQTLEAVEQSGILGSDRLSGLTGIAHSTGASALLEHTEQFGNRFTRMVFAAPLIRVFAFPILEAGADIVGQIVDQLPDRISGSTTNDAYIEFAEKHDTLKIRHTDLEWFQAYLRWEESLQQIAEQDTPLLLILAGDDTVVANDYNEEFLRRVFTDIRVIEVENIRHSVFTEAAVINGTVLAEMLGFVLD